MFKWLLKLLKMIFTPPYKTSCDLYDELNHCCALEHMECICQKKYKNDKPAWSNPAACFDEMD